MKNSKKIAVMGLMLALMFVLGYVENMLPPIPFLPPNVKLGLANVLAMYCIFFVGKKEAYTLAILKSAFVLMSRGPIAAVLSLIGGLLSVTVIIVAVVLFKDSLSYITDSILGAIFHNIGQLLAFSVIMKSGFVFYYFPVLLIAGIIMGAVTGGLLKVIMPYFKSMIRDEHSSGY